MPTCLSPSEGNVPASMDWLTRTYDPIHDHSLCPQGQFLIPFFREEHAQAVEYRAAAGTCNRCPVKAACTPNKRGRHLHRSFFAAYLDRVKAYEHTLAYHKALNSRKVWIEPLFGEGKQWHGMRRFRLRRHGPRQLRSLADCRWAKSQTPPAASADGVDVRFRLKPWPCCHLPSGRQKHP
jgi:Transposase DDE domain